jgi:hypothetical protein
MESHNMTLEQPKTPSEASQSQSELDHLEGPLLTVMPTKPLLEMSDEELNQFHQYHRTHRLSMVVLNEHLANRSKEKQSVSVTKQSELKEKYQ